MANTVVFKDNVITLTLDSDFTLAASGSATGTELAAFADTGLPVDWIHFSPSGADTLIICNGSFANDAEIFREAVTAATDNRIRYYRGRWLKPQIDFSDCTFATAANARVSIKII